MIRSFSFAIRCNSSRRVTTPSCGSTSNALCASGNAYDSGSWNATSPVRHQSPANFAAVLDVLTTLGTYTYRLEPRTEQYLDQVDWGNDFWSGYPTDYSFWNGQIRLFPPPQGGLPVTVKGTAILTPQPLTNDTDTNAWLTSAEELIRTRATRQIYGRYIRDPEQYALYTQLEKEALSNLHEKNIGQTGLNSIRPHL